MFDKDIMLLAELRRFATSHRLSGERRTAELLDRAVSRIVELTRGAEPESHPTCGCVKACEPEKLQPGERCVNAPTVSGGTDV